MSKLFNVLLLLAFCQSLYGQIKESKNIEINGMKVEWTFSENRIEFIISAPTVGWVAIGFNETENLSKTHLIMGRVNHEKAEIIEYYIISPGIYKPIKSLGGETDVSVIKGVENKDNTELRFSLPINNVSNYQKPLKQGTTYQMLLAYSVSDDFRHHSIMRTTVKIEL